jgi:cytochrome P450
MLGRPFTRRIRAAARQGLQAGAIRAFTLRERLESGASWNPATDRYLIDPYATYRRLREKDPIHRSRLFNGWVVSRHADIVDLLRHSALSADDRNLANYEKNRQRRIREGVESEDSEEAFSMLRLDPPDHTRLRTLVSKAFTPRAVEALRPRVEHLVDELVGAMGAEADIIADLAVPLPVTVIAEMLGIPAEDRAQFKAWSDDIAVTVGLTTLDDLRRANRAQAELNAYLAPIIEERRREPREDLLSALVRAEEEGDRLTLAEVFSTISLLLVAGNETTTNLIGNGLLALMRNPEQFQVLRDAPALVPGAVEELLRYDSPVQLTSRAVLEDFEFRGRSFRKGQEVDVLLGSANRDPEVFADPDRLDVTRTDVRHLSFGHGIHYCLGAPLARLEGGIAFAALVTRFRAIRQNGKARRGRNIVLRGLTRLPVKLER